MIFPVSSNGIYYVFSDGSAMMHNFLIFTFMNCFNSIYVCNVHSLKCFTALQTLWTGPKWEADVGGWRVGGTRNPDDICNVHLHKCLRTTFVVRVTDLHIERTLGELLRTPWTNNLILTTSSKWIFYVIFFQWKKNPWSGGWAGLSNKMSRVLPCGDVTHDPSVEVSRLRKQWETGK